MNLAITQWGKKRQFKFDRIKKRIWKDYSWFIIRKYQIKKR
jgi:hypothetical protein